MSGYAKDGLLFVCFLFFIFQKLSSDELGKKGPCIEEKKSSRQNIEQERDVGCFDRTDVPSVGACLTCDRQHGTVARPPSELLLPLNVHT